MTGLGRGVSGARVCMWVCAPRDNLGYHPHLDWFALVLVCFFFRQDFSLALRSPSRLGWLVKKLQESAYLCSPSSEIIRLCHCPGFGRVNGRLCFVFNVGTGESNSVLMITQQTPCKLCYLLRPEADFVNHL